MYIKTTLFCILLIKITHISIVYSLIFGVSMLQIISENQYLLDILNKNPKSDNGLYLTCHKEGVVVGQVVDNNTYNCYFIEKGNSYYQDESDQLEYESLCSPLMYCDLITELFYKHLLQCNKYDSKIPWLNKTFRELDNTQSKIIINNLAIKSKSNVKLLQNTFVDNIVINHKLGYLYELELTSDSIFVNLNQVITILIMLFYNDRPENKPFVNDEYLKKYTSGLSNSTIVNYNFICRFVRSIFISIEQFNRICPKFDNFELNFYDNKTVRNRKICEEVDLYNNVLDIGCGWFDYYKRLTKMGFRNQYFANDIIDKSIKVRELNERYKINNLVWVDSLDKMLDFNGTIIFTEVIEHLEYNDAIDLLQKILKLSFKQLFITTPNKDFNVNYGLKDNEFRHDDHKFELTFDEFQQVIRENTVRQCKTVTIHFTQIGDTINGISSTSYAKIVRI